MASMAGLGTRRGRGSTAGGVDLLTPAAGEGLGLSVSGAGRVTAEFTAAFGWTAGNGAGAAAAAVRAGCAGGRDTTAAGAGGAITPAGGSVNRAGARAGTTAGRTVLATSSAKPRRMRT